MGLEQASAALESDLANTSSSSAPADQGTGQPSGPIDLDTADKVRWEGKEYSPADFKKMMMFQQDYTRKTQSVSESQKYYQNLEYDLEAVKNDPKLAAEFQKLYPKEFHKFLKVVMPKEWGGEGQKQGDLPPEIQEKLDRFDSYIKNQEVSAEEAKIESITSKLAQKYPDAIEDVVLARAQALVEQGHALNPEIWDKLYKTSHDFMVKKMTEKQTKQFDTQKNLNQQGRGIGPGGGTPGQAPVKRTMAQATEDAIRDMGIKR